MSRIPDCDTVTYGLSIYSLIYEFKNCKVWNLEFLKGFNNSKSCIFSLLLCTFSARKKASAYSVMAITNRGIQLLEILLSKFQSSSVNDTTCVYYVHMWYMTHVLQYVKGELKMLVKSLTHSNQ